MPSRLAVALLSSIILHLGVLASADLIAWHLPAPAATPAMLEALLVPVPKPAPLLKDTLAEEASKPSPQARVPDPSGRKAATAAAQRKLADQLYYPPEAIARGLEGEVRLLLTLAGDGAIREATVARSSGHTILDQAAIRAAYAMGRLPGADRSELILPVVFRLQP